MIPAGYLLKRPIPPPEWLATKARRIEQVCSVSECVSEDLVDPYAESPWQFNQHGLASRPETLVDMAKRQGADFSDSTLFFYRYFEKEMYSDGWDFDREFWEPLSKSTEVIPSRVLEPRDLNLTEKFLGYDVTTFESGIPDCLVPVHSPLSCNSVATDELVNSYCLFDNFTAAKQAVENSIFGTGCEPGVYRIVSVSLVEGFVPE